MEGVDVDVEAGLLTALTTDLGQYVLLGLLTPAQAYATLDHHLDKLYRPG